MTPWRSKTQGLGTDLGWKQAMHLEVIDPDGLQGHVGRFGADDEPHDDAKKDKHHQEDTDAGKHPAQALDPSLLLLLRGSMLHHPYPPFHQIGSPMLARIIHHHLPLPRHLVDDDESITLSISFNQFTTNPQILIIIPCRQQSSYHYSSSSSSPLHPPPRPS